MAERDVLSSCATACAAKTIPDHRESALKGEPPAIDCWEDVKHVQLVN